MNDSAVLERGFSEDFEVCSLSVEFSFVAGNFHDQHKGFVGKCRLPF